jgi:hypothetical protein
MPGIELTKEWYFTIFGKMTMTKGAYDHGLTPILSKGNIFIKKVWAWFSNKDLNI